MRKTKVGDPVLRRELGGRLLRLRRRAGWTQVELARRAGVDHCFISFLEQGARGVTVECLLGIGRALGVPLSRLLRDIR